MLQQQVYVINTILMIFDAFGVVFAGYGGYYIKAYMSGGIWSMDANIFIFSILFIMFLNNYSMGRFDLYGDKRPASLFQLLLKVFQAVFISFAVLSSGIFMTLRTDYSRLFLLCFALLTFFIIFFQRIILRVVINRSSPENENLRKLVIIGNEKRAGIVKNILLRQQSFGMNIAGRISVNREDSQVDVLGHIKDLAEFLKKHTIDEVVFAIDSETDINISPYLDICRKMGVSSRILPSLWQPGDYGLSVEKCQNIPFLTIQMDNFNVTGLLYKRILDIIGGLVGVMLFLVMYPFVAIAIKMDSKGPVLFKQKRKGKHGRIFELYKFRSMYVDAEEQKKKLMKHNVMGEHMFKVEDDPRITRVGKFIRKTSIDEFPQFINVVRGEMSLVGTRPPTLDEVEEYRLEHLKRISAKPGITGLWQVSGRNSITDFEKIVELDSKYMDNWRFRDDLKIILKTVWIVFQRRGVV